jgi:hypothetical protein
MTFAIYFISLQFRAKACKFPLTPTAKWGIISLSDKT